MGLVGGDRHYTGGLAEAGWTCPACGADQSGPLAQGCVNCGAGRPGHRAAERVATARPGGIEDTPPPPLPPQAQPTRTVFERWVDAHPGATLQDAFQAGFVEGVRAAHAGAKQHAHAQTRQQTETYAPEHRMTRTLIAALTLFKDQVLVEADQEIASGEWASIDDVNQLLAHLRQQLTQEVPRA
jgi:hypothetical protein